MFLSKSLPTCVQSFRLPISIPAMNNLMVSVCQNWQIMRAIFSDMYCATMHAWDELSRRPESHECFCVLPLAALVVRVHSDGIHHRAGRRPSNNGHIAHSRPPASTHSPAFIVLPRFKGRHRRPYQVLSEIREVCVKY